MNTELEMQNGTVEVTLNFYSLYQLKTKHPKEYKRFFEIRKNGFDTELDAVELIYIAYLCANMEAMPNVMSYEEFLRNMKNGRARVWETIEKLNIDEKKEVPEGIRG